MVNKAVKSAGFDEILKDRQLNINTIGRDETHSDEHHSPYEPTPYCVLDRMLASGVFDNVSCLIDYGCGERTGSALKRDKTKYNGRIHCHSGFPVRIPYVPPVPENDDGEPKDGGAIYTCDTLPSTRTVSADMNSGPPQRRTNGWIRKTSMKLLELSYGRLCLIKQYPIFNILAVK